MTDKLSLEDSKRMYIRWKNMRGLRSPSWDKFSTFLADSTRYGMSEVLARPDRTKPFGVDNFEWLTKEEHSQGKNNPNFKGAETHTPCKFCEADIKSFVGVIPSRIYCSKECRYADDKKARICVHCSSIFIPEYKASTKYCSDVCSQEHRIEVLLEAAQKEKEVADKEALKKARREILFCKICGARIERYRSEGRKYCSRECYYKSVSLRQAGDKHHNWKGGVTERKDSVRAHPLYKEWRKKVFSRDGYTCQSCFSKGGILHAHHIASYKDNIKVRLKVSNGITVCGECHRQWHIFDRAGCFEGAERTFQDKAKKAFESAGFFVFVVHGGPYQIKGIPDMIMCFCGVFVAVELKVFPKFLEPLQKIQVDAIKNSGGLVYMARSEDDIERIIDEVRKVAFSERPEE